MKVDEYIKDKEDKIAKHNGKIHIAKELPDDVELIDIATNHNIPYSVILLARTFSEMITLFNKLDTTSKLHLQTDNNYSWADITPTMDARLSAKIIAPFYWERDVNTLHCQVFLTAVYCLVKIRVHHAPLIRSDLTAQLLLGNTMDYWEEGVTIEEVFGGK